MADWQTWWLADTPGWGAVKLRQLTESLGSAGQILNLLKTEAEPERLWQWIKRCWGQTEEGTVDPALHRLRITPADVKRLCLHGKEQTRCREEYQRWQEKGIRFVTLADPDYPRRLRQIYDPPFAIYVRGNLPEEQRGTAAVIGARACSGYGIRQGRRISRELAEKGVQIISGLAYGVDSEGHRGALESGVPGATYAVFGCGVDQCYPPEHARLAEQILAAGGGLLSEFPMGTPPSPGRFPMRNRIISGLSDCILVMEARRRSGSLITVDQALEQGREVFALPGRVGDSLSEGCLHLIRHGANMLTGSEDVLEFLYPEQYMTGGSGKAVKIAQPEPESAPMPGTGDRSEKDRVYGCLDSIGKTVEEIMEWTGLPLATVRSQLLELLLEEQIMEPVKGYYSLRL